MTNVEPEESTKIIVEWMEGVSNIWGKERRCLINQCEGRIEPCADLLLSPCMEPAKDTY
jgi:hypothetical protein